MSDLIVPGLPGNVRIAGVNNPGALTMVESDLYNVAGRLKEIDPRLYLVYHEGHEHPWVVMMEDIDDGNTYFVSKYKEADARILEDVNRMKNIPAEKRFAETMKRIDAENAKREAVRPMDEEWFEPFEFEFRKALKQSGLEPGASMPYSVRHTKKKG